MAEGIKLDAKPIMAKMREQFGAQMQDYAFLEVQYDNAIQKIENLKLEIEKKDKQIKAYENKEKVTKKGGK